MAGEVVSNGSNAFILGAALIAVYQWAKFAELDHTEPVIGRYLARVQRVNAKDFTGTSLYYATLLVFLSFNLAVYYVICHLPDSITAGIQKLLPLDQQGKIIADLYKDKAFPLYLAAVFMGLTQPVIPWIAKLRDAQRDFFHNRIEVPRRLIDLTASLAAAIDARSGGERKKLEHEVLNLIGDDWLLRLSALLDIPFYRAQLDQLRLGDPTTATKTLRDSSLRELRERVEDVVLLNLLALTRKSGPKKLAEVARMIAPNFVVQASNLGGFVSAILLSGLVLALAMLTIWHTFDLLRVPAESYFGKDRLWPAPNYLGGQLARIAPSIFVCLLIAAYGAASIEREDSGVHRPLSVDSLARFAQDNAAVIFVCFLASLIIHITAEFYDYGTPDAGTPGTAITLSKLAIIFVRTTPSLAASYCMLLYLASERHGRKLRFVGMLAVTTLATSALALLVAETFLQFDFLLIFPALAPGYDFVLFYVLANALVTFAGFAVIVLFFHTQVIVPRTGAALRTMVARRRAH